MTFLKKVVATQKPNEFVMDYIVCALWSSHDDREESDDEHLDANFGWDDLSDEAMERAVKDCADFCKKAKEKLGEAFDELDHKQVAHDFWLTRNGHGAGFGDGNYEDIEDDNGESIEVGDVLGDLAKTFKEVDIYAGDDGKLYFQ